MAKNENNVAEVSPVVAIFGDHTVEVKSRGEGTNFVGKIAALSPAGLVAAVQAGVADILNSKAVVTLAKPSKDDFADVAEYEAALAEFQSEKAKRKAAAWEGLHTGVFPEFAAKSWTSPLRLEIDRIVLADLTTYFSGKAARTSTPKQAYTLPAVSSATYKGLADKWLSKYKDEITEEAKRNIANGVITAAPEPADVAEVEF